MERPLVFAYRNSLMGMSVPNLLDVHVDDEPSDQAQTRSDKKLEGDKQVVEEEEKAESYSEGDRAMQEPAWARYR